MAKESVVFGLLTLVEVVGTVVLLVGVGAFEGFSIPFIAVGGAIMVVGILTMAGYVQLLEEPEGVGGEAGH